MARKANAQKIVEGVLEQGGEAVETYVDAGELLVDEEPDDSKEFSRVRSGTETFVRNEARSIAAFDGRFENALSVEDETEGATTTHHWRITGITDEWGDPDGGDGPEIDEVEITYQTADFNGIQEDSVTVDLVREVASGIDRVEDIGLNSGTQPYNNESAILDLSGFTNTTVAGPLEIEIDGIDNPETAEFAQIEVRGDGETYRTHGIYPNPLSLISTLDTSNIHLFDVGQADASLIQTRDDETILIDTANSYDDFGWAMEELGVDHVDVLVSTHAHSDHIGGAEAFIERFESELDGVDLIIDSGIEHGTQTYNDYIDKIDEHDVSLVLGEEGD